MAEQLTEAGMLLAVGMSVVFAFLTLLIGGIKGIAWYCKMFPSPEDTTSSANNSNTHKNNNIAPTPAQATVSPQIKAAIQTAVNLHRHKLHS
ncbi:OadG family protein [Glaciecola sp. KUL10]|uniref:OadG family protein n=1 Tax=Glaciecola sp. (strain KUL10) TaxID=2161813 RepID=UPI000D970B38|nr:OadG family transporter subunit [Glaciecola sp. KUL10]GBL04012.1 oxaloacetate decarboxylase gamma chain [Glaciecola sp. KUL10]